MSRVIRTAGITGLALVSVMAAGCPTQQQSADVGSQTPAVNDSGRFSADQAWKTIAICGYTLSRYGLLALGHRVFSETISYKVKEAVSLRKRQSLVKYPA